MTSCALADALGGIAAADHRRDAQLARDDGGVAGAAAAIGDDGRGALHDRLPVRIGHVGDQHIAGLHAVHFARRCAPRAPGPRRSSGRCCGRWRAPSSGFFSLKRWIVRPVRLCTVSGPRLQDEDLAGRAVLAPLDVHRAPVVLLDDERLAGERDDVGVGQGEALARSAAGTSTVATRCGGVAARRPS